MDFLAISLLNANVSYNSFFIEFLKVGKFFRNFSDLKLENFLNWESWENLSDWNWKTLQLKVQKTHWVECWNWSEKKLDEFISESPEITLLFDGSFFLPLNTLSTLSFSSYSLTLSPSLPYFYSIKSCRSSQIWNVVHLHPSTTVNLCSPTEPAPTFPTLNTHVERDSLSWDDPFWHVMLMNDGMALHQGVNRSCALHHRHFPMES